MILRRGSVGPEVLSWQSFLRAQGYSAVQVDSVFGVATETATIAFQRSAGLTPVGVVGPDTLRATTPPSSAPAAPAAPPSSARLSAAGRALIKGFEGLVLTAYPDGKTAGGAQLYSVGYGHNGVPQGTTITRAQADAYFDGDVARFEKAVASATPRAEPHQFDAMVSLSYNIGTEAFKASTVARRHASGDFHGAADAFELFNKETKGGVLVVSAVLVARRERERDVYLHGYGGGAGAPSSGLPSTASGGKTLLWGIAGVIAVLAMIGGKWR